MQGPVNELKQQVEKLHLSHATKHIFLCCNPLDSKCCSFNESQIAWDYLKNRLQELNLTQSEKVILRSKAVCLRICKMGPIVVIYPEGVWYHSCNPNVLEKILQEHLLKGILVQEYCFAGPYFGEEL